MHHNSLQRYKKNTKYTNIRYFFRKNYFLLYINIVFSPIKTKCFS